MRTLRLALFVALVFFATPRDPQ